MSAELHDENLTPARLQKWAEHAAAGGRLVYHVGRLAEDRSDRRIDAVAKTAADLAASNHFDLVQRRYGDFDHSYLIVRRRAE